MQILTVAPLAYGIPYEELSYFSKAEVSPGDLVEITIKRRVCKALVLEAHNAEEERQSLRHASFAIKKITKVITKGFLNPKMWKALSYSSSCLLRPLGMIIYDLLSEKSFDFLSPIVLPKEAKGFEILLLEQSYVTRMARYKTTIRESFSKKKSIIMFFPTITDLEYAKEELAKGIDEYVVSLHSSLTEKQYKEAYKKIEKEEHPLLVLTTPSLIPWIRSDIGLVILEREHSEYYYTYGDRGYDMRFVIEALAHASGVVCIFGSHMLSLRAHMLYKQKNAQETIPLHFRNDFDIQVLPMHEENKSASPYLSRKALSILHTAKLEEKGHYFLYAHRKGMYPTTVCSDCGSLFTCMDCKRPYVLHKIGGVRTYVCHSCENIVRLEEDTTLACKHCGGWRMALLGISTGGVNEELERLKIPTFVIDGEHTSTKVKAKKVFKEWRESSYGILIGTEMAENMIRECDGIIVLSLDPLFSLPEYRIDEKILNLVTEMADKIKTKEGEKENKLLLQTRLRNMPVFKQIISPSFREVFETLLKEREQFLLPPYYTVIKASFTNLSEALRARMEQELDPYTVEWFEQGRGVTLLFIHIKESEWQNNLSVRERIKQIVASGNPSVNPLHFFI